MNPYSPIPRFVSAPGHLGLIHRLLRRDAPEDTQRIDLITTSFKRVSVVDSGVNPGERIAEGDTAVHTLYIATENNAEAHIGTERFAIAPGDTFLVPSGDAFRLPAHMLAIEVAVRKPALTLPVAPTHGDYHFEGYNRESRYPEMGQVRLSRWKLSQTLAVPAPESELVLVGLHNDIAIQHRGGVTMLPRGEASVIRPETGPITLVPNGLSYVLAIS